MKLKNKDVGIIGENLATQYLTECRHEILARNYRSICGELDIVSCEKGKVHFVEVKTVVVADISRETGNISAEEHVSREKLAKIARTAHIFMDEFGFYDNSAQIDVMGLYLSREFYKRHQRDTILGPIKDIDYRIEYLENVG